MKNSKRNIKYILLGTLFVAVVALGILLLATTKCEVVLSGEPEVVIEYGEDYCEMGAYAQLSSWLFGVASDKTDVSPAESLPQGPLGVYTLTYSCRFLWYHDFKVRTVQIVDTKAPAIILAAGDGYTLPGHEYVEEGFYAQDNYDGDITENVIRTVKDGTVVYTVKDTSGNTATMVRKINYNDVTAPELTLNGDATIAIKAGTAYVEPGYYAVDDADGDVTHKVEVSGLPDVYRCGTYTVSYSVTDGFGNTTVKTRKVIVEPYSLPQTVIPQGKVIYLTFDDGPGSHTERLLNVLEQYDVKATFFVADIGCSHLLPRIAEAGHSIGIHTASHRYDKIYASVDAYFEDFRTIENLIYRRTGIKTNLMRFPGGSTNLEAEKYCPGIMANLRKMVTEMGYQYFDWNVSAGDSKGHIDSDQVFNNVINGIQGKKTAIVLQHDIFDYSVDAVEKIIQWGLENGYEFMPLDATSPTCHHG